MPTNCDNVTTLPPRMPLVFVGAGLTATEVSVGAVSTANVGLRAVVGQRAP